MLAGPGVAHDVYGKNLKPKVAHQNSSCPGCQQDVYIAPLMKSLGAMVGVTSPDLSNVMHALFSGSRLTSVRAL
jgi:hypothetical protein